MPKRNANREAALTDSAHRTDASDMRAHARWYAADPMQGGTAGSVRAADAESGDALPDWDDLFNAVMDRLTRTVAENRHGAGASWRPGATQIRNAVLESVAALHQLRATMAAQRARVEGLEMAVFEAQTSLAQVRAALVGTQQDERRARHDAAHDSLTQLPHRGVLLERINQELASTEPRQRLFAVLFLDLDGFKLVNDNHGHAVGDELLRIIAARLRRVVRAQDVVSRVGGDEFALLIGAVHDHAQLAQLADKMEQAVSAPCTIGPLKLAVHASIGIATSPVDGQSADALLKSADLAMYAAKRRNTGHAFSSRGGAAAAAHARGAAMAG